MHTRYYSQNAIYNLVSYALNHTFKHWSIAAHCHITETTKNFYAQLCVFHLSATCGLVDYIKYFNLRFICYIKIKMHFRFLIFFSIACDRVPEWALYGGKPAPTYAIAYWTIRGFVNITFGAIIFSLFKFCVKHFGELTIRDLTDRESVFVRLPCHRRRPKDASARLQLILSLRKVRVCVLRCVRRFRSKIFSRLTVANTVS